ncbi:hypothetical protein NBRC116583_36800 [Arenicella sp. 4NH20-0111]
MPFLKISLLWLSISVCAMADGGPQRNLAPESMTPAQGASLPGVEYAAALAKGHKNTAHSLDAERVKVESDGSLTPRSENIIDVLAALDSGVGAAVNFTMSFSHNTYVLTADGKQTLGVIADAIRYLDSEVSIDIEMPAESAKDKELTIRRGRELVRILSSNYGLKNQIRFYIASSYDRRSSSGSSKTNKGSDLKRVTLLNLGTSG